MLAIQDRGVAMTTPDGSAVVSLSFRAPFCLEGGVGRVDEASASNSRLAAQGTQETPREIQFSPISYPTAEKAYDRKRKRQLEDEHATKQGITKGQHRKHKKKEFDQEDMHSDCGCDIGRFKTVGQTYLVDSASNATMQGISVIPAH